jgi:hypothetical protein
MWNLVLVHLEIVLVSVQDSCTVCTEHKIGLEIIFERTQWNSLVMWVMWNLILVCFEIVLVSVQDMFIVCAMRTIGSERILDTPDGTP